MPSHRLVLSAAACAAVLAVPASAAAAPPPNDNYLASTRIVSSDGGMPREFRDRVDTSEATTQPDTFNPNSQGQPFGGGDPEPTSCADGTTYGRTAWWDFEPPFAGGVELKASGGFEVVVAVYEWSEETSRITRVVRCQNDSTGSETVLLPEVRRGTNYTVQVGGAGDTGGPLDLELTYFPDRDADGVLDALDKCDRRRGIEAFGGCPPELRSAPRIRFDGVPGGIRVRSLAVDDVVRGSRVEVRCRRCGSRVTRRARRAGSLRLRGFVGRVVRAGDRIEVRITQPPTGNGRFRFGAVGKYFRWPITSAGLGNRVSRCLNPGSRRPRRCR
jgi:hypothetical protein